MRKLGFVINQWIKMTDFQMSQKLVISGRKVMLCHKRTGYFFQFFRTNMGSIFLQYLLTPGHPQHVGSGSCTFFCNACCQIKPAWNIAIFLCCRKEFSAGGRLSTAQPFFVNKYFCKSLTLGKERNRFKRTVP